MVQALIRTITLLFALLATAVGAQDNPDYSLGPGDVLRIQVFQNPDLTTETRVSENGNITYPLIGTVDVGGLDIGAAEKKIAAALKKGGFIRQPQVNIVLLQMRGNQVSVLRGSQSVRTLPARNSQSCKRHAGDGWRREDNR